MPFKLTRGNLVSCMESTPLKEQSEVFQDVMTPVGVVVEEDNVVLFSGETRQKGEGKGKYMLLDVHI